ncbi:uncharacterized protein LOC129574417 [Sitodiplosis mosellana]|uniref:uncharacterized protein LOC129574417 n=1 Tax=Sitodiplosis mosellana TaxID=263140 RepID=UPI002445092D|nr:uncharacterized protein LOC129574417 [Sitodiplosis mosellana]
MNSIQVITFVAIALSMSFVKCDPPKPNVDAKCLVPPPNDVDPMLCCKIPEILDSKLIEICATKVYGPESNPSNNQNEPPFAPHIRCVTECILNETGILKDRMFQPMVASELAKKTLGPKSVWMPIVEEALQACNEHASKAKFVDHKACGHMGAFIVACLNTQLFKNCPESAWNNAGKGCAALREMTIKCPIIAPIPSQD